MILRFCFVSSVILFVSLVCVLFGDFMLADCVCVLVNSVVALRCFSAGVWCLSICCFVVAMHWRL